MQFNVSKDSVNMLELLSKSTELRRLAYVIAAMVWVILLIKAIRWW